MNLTRTLIRIALVPTAVSLALVFCSCSKQPKTFATLDERMEHQAKVAAETIQKETGIAVNFTVTSVKFVEQTLNRLSQSVGKTDPQKAESEAFCYGAYVGECLRKKAGGSWVETQTDGKTDYHLKAPSGAVFTPVAWCYQRITGDEKANVYRKVLDETKKADAPAKAQ